jgi:hypothetical protein
LFFVPRLFYSRFKLSLAENLKKSLFFIHTRLQPEKSCQSEVSQTFIIVLQAVKKRKPGKIRGKSNFLHGIEMEIDFSSIWDFCFVVESFLFNLVFAFFFVCCQS